MQTDRRGRRGFWEHLDVRIAGRRGGVWVWSKAVNGSWEGFGGGGGQEVWMCYYAGDAAWGWGLPGRQASAKGIRMPQEGDVPGDWQTLGPHLYCSRGAPALAECFPPPHLPGGHRLDPGLEASPGERSLQELGSAG